MPTRFILDEIQDFTLDEFQAFTRSTASPTASLTTALMGMCGESGEALDHLKKHLEQGHPIDDEKLIKECGDVLYYVAQTADKLGLPLSAVAKRNVKKLRARYPEGWDPARSLNRAPEDK